MIISSTDDTLRFDEWAQNLPKRLWQWPSMKVLHVFVYSLFRQKSFSDYSPEPELDFEMRGESTEMDVKILFKIERKTNHLKFYFRNTLCCLDI